MEDLKKLKIQYGISYGAYWDVGAAAGRCIRPFLKKRNLSYLFDLFYNANLPKPKNITMGNWEANVLSDNQIKYAAWDALSSLKIWEHLYMNTVAFDFDSAGNISPPGAVEDGATLPLPLDNTPHFDIHTALLNLLQHGVHPIPMLLHVPEPVAAVAAGKSTEVLEEVVDTSHLYFGNRPNYRIAVSIAEESDVYMDVLCKHVLSFEQLSDIYRLGKTYSEVIVRTLYCF